MINLETLFCSNIPIDCHILKGRLESENINCYVFDENLVYVHPFKAVAIGGVKLKVPSNQIDLAREIIEKIEKGILFDERGEYDVAKTLHLEYERQSEILNLKHGFRRNPVLLQTPNKIKSKILEENEIDQLIDSEKVFHTLANKKFEFRWKDFFYELFDFDRDISKYFRQRPVEYYFDKELVDNYRKKSASEMVVICPNCKSGNTSYGYAIDHMWEIVYLILSLLLFTPFPLMRKKTHCFDCGLDFKAYK